MRTDRLLAILLLLQTHKRMTTSQLAARLHVSERTIHRDLEVLSSSGFPVYAERGKHGGWKLMEHYQSKLATLGPQELPTLFLPVPARLLRDLGMEKDAQLAQLKLLETLPENLRATAASIHQRIYLDTSSWHAAEETHEWLPVLLTGVWEERKVAMRYTRSDGSTRERMVSPLGLVAKGTVWYLIAAVDGEIRNYRVNRITRAEVTDESFERPAGFNLAAYWEESSRRFVENLPRYEARVRVDAAYFPRLSSPGRFPLIRVLREADDEGWMEVALQFQVEEEACAFIMGAGGRMEILEPAALREKVKRLAAEILQLYHQTER
ncbi:WYL domain-containing protein [Brevibacillus sp. SYP-B805]|uniref:helix-turn-helix transcriptional regulator n=1 Tax=Brevibacillus sp. SYP-B805 TaxID=1578199 RepID=UPI0013ED7AF7|nr:WYL domain-containing protein [Brevibacillus sp. SYP-B805]NGQ96777.1 WYL domain-containing protein [Brevibacillus sp. SYP-B805]